MTRHRLPLAALLAAVALALTGCTGAAPANPISTPAASSPAASPSATATPAIPAPAAVDPAGSETEAISAANQSLTGYYTASFESGHAGGTRLDLVTPWVTGAALQNERALATYLQQKHYRLDGAPTGWNLSPDRSTATRAKAADGTVIRYGSAELVGCIASTNHPVGSGAPTWTTKGRHTSIQWTVVYSPTTRRWLVAASTSPSPVLKATSCG